MKDYFIDKVNVIVDGKPQVETIGAMGSYDPNWIKNKAISGQKKVYPKAKITAVIIEHRQVTAEEYKKIFGPNFPWSGPTK